MGFIADSIYSNPISQLNTPLAWFAIISYTFQIYFDFSGYSDMAIGLGRMFGFHFNENFNLPYISTSITEFWRRWHISLSTWFKQYLYIPLGGNRKGRSRTYFNLLIVFLITGLWHGANYTFILWGLYYAIFLIIEKAFFKKLLDKNKFKFLNHIYTMLIIIVGWVLFRSNTLSETFSLFKLMFSFNFKTQYVLLPTYINNMTIITFVVAFLFSGPIQSLFLHIKESKRLKIVSFYKKNLEIVVISLLLIFCIMEIVANTYNPFLYFRF